MIGHQTHLKENEDLPLLDSPFIFRPNWGPKGKKQIFGESPPLSQGLDAPPPPSEGLDPPLKRRYVFVVVVVLLVCLFLLFFAHLSRLK